MGKENWLKEKVSFCWITLGVEMKVAVLEMQTERLEDRSVIETQDLEVVHMRCS